MSTKKKPTTPTSTTRPPTFVEFCRSAGIKLTPAQAAIASVAFDGAPVPAEYADLFDFDGLPPATATKIVEMVFGRAAGKTSAFCAPYLVWSALFADASRLRPGELGFCVFVAPNTELARQGLRFVIGMLEGSPLVESQDADSITIRRPDGKRMRIEVCAASVGGATLRGRELFGVALDEAAFFKDAKTGVVNDRAHLDAAMPRLRGKFLIASTPWLQQGLFYDLWKENFGMPESALVIHAPTDRMRTDDPDLLERIQSERERNAYNARREYDCEFLPAGAGTLFDVDELTQAIVPDVYAPIETDVIYIGGDLGFTQDPSAFVAVRRRDDGSLDVVDVAEFNPPVNFDDMVMKLTPWVQRNGRGPIRVDGYGFALASQALERGGFPVTLQQVKNDPATRIARFSAAVVAFQSGRVKIPTRFSSLTDQLSALTAQPQPGGGWKFSAPRANGHHCDAAQALILAIEAALAHDDDGGFGNLMNTPGGPEDLLDAMIGFGGVREHWGNTANKIAAAREMEAHQARRMSRMMLPEITKAKAAEQARLAAEESEHQDRQRDAERLARKAAWIRKRDGGDGGAPPQAAE